MTRLGSFDLAVERIDRYLDRVKRPLVREKLFDQRAKILVEEKSIGKGLGLYTALRKESTSKRGKKRSHKLYVKRLISLGYYKTAAPEVVKYLRSSNSRYLRWQRFWSHYMSGDYQTAKNAISRSIPPLDKRYKEMLYYWRIKARRSLVRKTILSAMSIN